jgi:hypothetical protein
MLVSRNGKNPEFSFLAEFWVQALPMAEKRIILLVGQKVFYTRQKHRIFET